MGKVDYYYYCDSGGMYIYTYTLINTQPHLMHTIQNKDELVTFIITAVCKIYMRGRDPVEFVLILNQMSFK